MPSEPSSPQSKGCDERHTLSQQLKCRSIDIHPCLILVTRRGFWRELVSVTPLIIHLKKAARPESGAQPPRGSVPREPRKVEDLINGWCSREFSSDSVYHTSWYTHSSELYGWRSLITESCVESFGRRCGELLLVPEASSRKLGTAPRKLVCARALPSHREPLTTEAIILPEAPSWPLA